MEQHKVNYLIDIINDMDIKNKLRLAIRMSDSNYTNLKYDKPEMYEIFDNQLKELDERYPDSKLDANMKDSKRTLKEEILNTPLNEEDFKAHAILPDIEKKDVVVQKDHSFVIDAQSAAQAHANTKGR